MEDNEIFENNEIIENNDEVVDSAEPSSAPDTTEITNEQIIDAIKEVIYEHNENDIEGDSVSGNSIVSEDNSASTPVVIDYSSDLSAIKNLLIENNSSLVTISEYQQTTIFDKELNSYSVSEGLLIILTICVFVHFVVDLIKEFTPSLW